ncbi:hypothetical protein F5X96DRAFT_145682 [Biscogniauxia mediterranea]|nr:hypothetical protein F5X96DRAFT_145682 [Biscogniauxia mediterranea]
MLERDVGSNNLLAQIPEWYGIRHQGGAGEGGVTNESAAAAAAGEEEEEEDHDEEVVAVVVVHRDEGQGVLMACLFGYRWDRILVVLGIYINQAVFRYISSCRCRLFSFFLFSFFLSILFFIFFFLSVFCWNVFLEKMVEVADRLELLIIITNW